MTALAAPLTVVAAHADAAPAPDRVSYTDAFVKATCQFSVSSVSYATDTVRVRLTTKSGPASFSAARNVAHSGVKCTLLSADFIDTLASTEAERNGSHVYKSATVTVPQETAYEICLRSTYTLRNGEFNKNYACTPGPDPL